jgi:DNA-binding transcriptional LysR family regulator/CRP-like cAMP-binding protein
MVARMVEGSTIEVATIGNEGVVGLSAYLGNGYSPMPVFVQIPGEALRMDADVFLREIRTSSAWRAVIRRYSEALLTQVGQSAACNRAHTIGQRCARWLLMSHDRVLGDEIALTQEYLGEMLGVRRASVTQSAGRLKRRRLIDYHRGMIRVLDRRGLEGRPVVHQFHPVSPRPARRVDASAWAQTPRYFAPVAEGFISAGRHSTEHLQPSARQQIQDLERELKVDLFLRTKRHVELTPAGSRFLQEARGILASAERAAGLAREAARNEALKLVIGVSADTDWLLLGKTLRLFGEHAPSVEVGFQNLTPEAQIAALRGGQIDVGFVSLPLAAEGLVTETTGRARLVVALPENHPMARKSDVRLEELSKEAYVLWPRHLSPGRYDQLLAVFQRAGFGPPISMEGGMPSTRTVLGMIAAGLTIALVDPNLDHVVSPGVVFRPLTGREVFIETGVVHRRADASPILLSFLDEVRATPPARNAPSAAPEKQATGKRAPRKEAAEKRTMGASRAVRPRISRTRRTG